MKHRRRRAPIQQRFWMAKARALAAQGYTSHQIRLKLPMLNQGSLSQLRREMNVKRWSHDVTVARVGFMRSLYKSGVSEMKIAEIYGMTVYKVRRHLRVDAV
ncbi:MAG TPA: hypothetical protein VFC07_12630 [Verrucomicrobiae bacterium]|nr:hypothetical protein [Verrucomicrobiae bacterium]